MNPPRRHIATWMLAAFGLLMVSVCLAGNQTVSGALASSIIDQARRYVHDPTTHGSTQQSIWSDTEMLQWVNDGTLDIVARTHCLENTEAETLVADQTDYPLTDPFIVIKYVIFDNSAVDRVYALIKGSPEEIGRTGSSEGGTPTHWAQWENNLIIYPPPDSTAAGKTVTAYVVDRPVDVASGAAILVPAQYDKALVYYVAAQAHAKDGLTQRAAGFMQLYLAELERYKIDFSGQAKSE